MMLIDIFNVTIDFIYKKRKEYFFSIVVCIFLCYFIDTYALSFDRLLYNEKRIDNCFNGNLKYIYNVKYTDYLDDNYYQFYQELYSIKGFENFGTFDKSTSFFWEKGVDYDSYFYIEGDGAKSNYYDNGFIDIVGSCINFLNIVDNNGDKLVNPYNNEYETNDIWDDENHSPIPLYIGYKYKEHIPIGTILKEGYTTDEINDDTDLDTVNFKYCEYIVAGFLAEDQYFLSENVIEEEEFLDNLDRAVICLKDSPKASYYTSFSCSSNFFFTSENADEVIPEIKKLASKHGIRVEIRSVENILKDIRKKEISNFKYYGIMLGIMICTSFVFLSFTSLMMLMIKKNDIGILYANGVTRKNMSAVILIINMICTIISGMIAFTIRTLILHNTYRQYGDEELIQLKQIQYVRNVYVSWQIIVFCIILAVISSVISIKVINSYSIRELIGNNE